MAQRGRIERAGTYHRGMREVEQQQARAPYGSHSESTEMVQDPSPALEEVRAVTDTSARGVAAVVRILRAYPIERDEIIAWLHQRHGNAFVGQVTAQLGQIERELPENVELQSVHGSVTIPAGRRLMGDWKATIDTAHATTLGAEVSQSAIRVWLSPALHVNATWPLRDAVIRGAGVRFVDGKAYANVGDGGGYGAVPAAGAVESTIVEKLEQAIAGTPLARPGYIPTQDADLSGTLNRVMQNLGTMFGDGAASSGDPAGVSARDLGNVSAGGKVALRAGASFMQDGTGLEVGSGAELSVTVNGGGDVQSLVESGSVGGAVQAARIQSIAVSASGLTVKSGDKAVAEITHMTIRPGGRVSIEGMRLLGKAADARSMEQGLSLLVGLLALANRDGSAAQSAFDNVQRPELVDGIARAQMEREFSAAVRAMILEYRAAVPGVDLAQALGVR